MISPLSDFLFFGAPIKELEFSEEAYLDGVALLALFEDT